MKKRKKAILLSIVLLCCLMPMKAQRACYGKMSSMVRRLAVGEAHPSSMRKVRQSHEGSLCAFIRISEDGSRLLRDNGCRELARFDDIYIADIPLSQLRHLSVNDNVTRIEAGKSCALTLDTTIQVVNLPPLYEGNHLPQAFTGKGVIVGLQDIGFDLTHPNFYDAQTGKCRISRFWDQLSVDTINSGLYVGRDYTTEDAILGYAHSCDAHLSGHGTHTLGIAAGGGFDTQYRGVAFESDICLVSNSITSDTVLIDEPYRYKYTTATDALGFKYIFDYADQQGKPCVISFSEGSEDDLQGDNQLFTEVLEKITGPGRIFVSSAGNEGFHNTFIHKPKGVEHTGAFFRRWGYDNAFLIKASGHFTLRMVVYESATKTDTLSISSEHILSLPDSLYTDTVKLLNEVYPIEIQAYPSGFNPQETGYDFSIQSQTLFGYHPSISYELLGSDADVCLYRRYGEIEQNDMNPLLTAGECSHSIFSPGSSPAAICVGATTHRTKLINFKGDEVIENWGGDGMRATYSGIGPTIDERIKPDVVAPGTAVVSSFSSFFREANPETDIRKDISYSEYQGRKYPWSIITGTSMSTPVVAGIIALWLEANPRLTPDEVREILRKTCRHCDESLTYPNNYYGYGEIDAYKGLLEVLQLSGMKEISKNPPSGLKFIPKGNGQFEIVVGHQAPRLAEVCVYNMQGVRQQCQFEAMGNDSYLLDIQSLPKGVYVVQLNNSHAGKSGSLLIRR